MAVDPQFAATPIVGTATLSSASAETQLAQPTLSQLLVTAGSNGTKIEEIDVLCVSATNLAAASTAGLVYLFINDGGTNYWLRDSIPVTAITASATVAPFQASRTYTNLWIPSGMTLRVSSSVGQTANMSLKITAFGGNY